MERLTSLLTLTFLLGIVSAADGQTFRFTAAGDVTNPNTWEGNYIVPGQPVYLLDLLKTAGYQGEGNAFIVRGNLLRNDSPGAVLSKFVSAQIKGQRSQLTNGDIVIFHQVSGTANVEEHILVITGKQREVVPLDKIGSRLGNLLTPLGVARSIHTRIPVTRTHHSTAVHCMVHPNDLLIHGDVVWLDGIDLLDDDARVRFSELFDEPQKTELVNPSNPTIQTVSDERTPDPGSHDIDSGDLTQPLQTSVTETSQVPAVPAVVKTIIPADTDGPVQAGVSGLPDRHLPAMRPVDTVVSPIWNTVFICGLLGSITLILGGWLKTYRDTTASRKQVIESISGVQPPQKILTPVAATASPSTASNKIQTDTSTFEVTTALDSQPVTLSQPIEDVVSENSMTDLSARPEPLVDSANTSSLVTEQEWFSGSWPGTSEKNSAPTVPVEFLKPSQESEPTAEVAPEFVETQTAPSVSENNSASDDAESSLPAADDLEDLIQNRLSVELQLADLPLQVTLFGRPAGPRRLRIDSAHTQISAPNFVAGSRSRPESSHNITEVVDLPDQDGQDTASLDRALNSLNEQRH